MILKVSSSKWWEVLVIGLCKHFCPRIIAPATLLVKSPHQGTWCQDENHWGNLSRMQRRPHRRRPTWVHHALPWVRNEEEEMVSILRHNTMAYLLVSFDTFGRSRIVKYPTRCLSPGGLLGPYRVRWVIVLVDEVLHW